MTTQGRFDLKGLDEYLEAIAKAGLDIDAAAQRAILKGAEVLQDGMLGLVPVGDAAKGDPHPGNLMRHIQVKGPLQDGNYSYAEVGVIHDLSFTDADTAAYGNVLEYGSTRQAAQPYIRPAIQGKKSAVLRTMKESLQSEGML
jgi:HK97 gp10 family phage protein